MKKLLFAVALLAMMGSASLAEPCGMTEKNAISRVPDGTVVLYGSKRAFTILYERFNKQRQSIGFGPTKADKIVVLLFLDTSVGIFMTRDGCYLKETSAYLKWDNWVGTMEDLKLTERDFTQGEAPVPELSL